LTSSRIPARFALCLLVLALPFTAAAQSAGGRDQPAQSASERLQRADSDEHAPHPLHEIDDAMVRLPLAAALGAALALRPRRRGTPTRDPAVIQTQIILAVVGAVIMLVVGASLARAFGIVGAANLIRYRSKIDDPKDAVVMLCALSVGLAAGVGLYGLSVIGTLFIVFCLWIIEGFEPQTRMFELTVKMGDKTTDLKPKIEEVLRRYKARYELRTTAEDNVVYMVTTPKALRTDRVSNAIMELAPDSKGAVEWSEKAKDKVPK
jgi:uncharacterized membrane protein YhiD involved in acid resistance